MSNKQSGPCPACSEPLSEDGGCWSCDFGPEPDASVPDSAAEQVAPLGSPENPITEATCMHGNVIKRGEMADCKCMLMYDGLHPCRGCHHTCGACL